MGLREKQSKFVRKIALLILFAEERGYELTFGDAYRDPRVFGESGEAKGYGRISSNHKRRLAVDFNLFVDSKYISDGNSAHWTALGEFWESIGGAWGGRFNDANHFSLEYNGYK